MPVRTDQRLVDGVTMVEIWYCQPPKENQPYMATICSWFRGHDESVVTVYQWEPL